MQECMEEKEARLGLWADLVPNRPVRGPVRLGTIKGQARGWLGESYRLHPCPLGAPPPPHGGATASSVPFWRRLLCAAAGLMASAPPAPALVRQCRTPRAAVRRGSPCTARRRSACAAPPHPSDGRRRRAPSFVRQRRLRLSIIRPRSLVHFLAVVVVAAKKHHP